MVSVIRRTSEHENDGDYNPQMVVYMHMDSLAAHLHVDVEGEDEVTDHLEQQLVPILALLARQVAELGRLGQRHQDVQEARAEQQGLPVGTLAVASRGAQRESVEHPRRTHAA